jgi:PAS domain S-box-containing protein
MRATESKLRRTDPGAFVVASAPGQMRAAANAGDANAVIEAIADFYGTWNFTSTELYFSDRWLASLGYSPADLSHEQGFFERSIHPDDRAVFESQLKAHLAGRARAWNCECRIRNKAGAYQWFEIHGRVTRESGNGAPAQLVGMVFDIEARKHQEERPASYEQLSSIFQGLNECAWIVDPVHFGLLAFNKSFEDRMFKSHGVLLRAGMRAEEIDSGSARNWKQYYNNILEQVKVGKDCRHRSSAAALEVVSRCLLRNGQVDAICLFGHDITPPERIEEALRNSEEKFTKAFLQCPVALVLTSNVDHRYIEVNRAFEENTGYRREEVIGKSSLEVGMWVDNEQQVKLVEELKTSGSARDLIFSFRNKSGEIRSGVGSAELIELNGEPCMLAAVVDFTEQKRAEEALRESEECLRIAIESGRMYAFEWDPATDAVRRSSLASEILGLRESELSDVKQELIEGIHDDDRDQYVRLLGSLSAQEPNYKTIFRLSRHDGTMIWLQEAGRAFFSANGKIRKVVGISSDVTELRRSEQALRELSQRLISSQEEERRRVARDLHDNIGQKLALVCIQAQRIDSGEAAEQHTDHSDMHELYQKIKVIGTDISTLSHRLHSSELNFLGLGIAAQRLCREFQDQYGIDVQCTVKNFPSKIEIGKSLCFYRVLQEALQNIAKHSHATRVIVELQARKDELTLRVSDNGKGFEMTSADFGPGLGLISVRERLNLVGGRFALSSKIGFGTTLTAYVPV